MRWAFIALLFACSAPVVAPSMDSGVEDAGLDAGFDAGEPDAGPEDKAAGCASVFGDALTTSFGRVDGTVTAVVTPADVQCPLPNSDHVVVQVRMDGGVYRMVVNVLGSGADTRVGLFTRDAPLPSPWEEGWHTDAGLDYPDAGAHSADFTLYTMAELVPRVSDPIRIGSKISVYATSSGGTFAASAHLIHRNGSNHDGALVLDADSAQPRWLLFRFPNQSF